MSNSASLGKASVSEQYADLDSAREFGAVILRQMDEAQLSDISRRLQERSRRVTLLIEDLHGHGALEELVSSFFGVRRRRQQILATVDREELISAVLQLVRGDLTSGIQGFLDLGIEDHDVARDFAMEILHSVHPERVALWTRWVWNPETETGALRLLVTEDADLFGATEVETLLLVTDVSRYLMHTLEASKLPVTVSQPFSLDVFLGAIYAVYTGTVLQMRMTKEFNQLLPNMTEFIERLLGVRVRKTVGKGE